MNYLKPNYAVVFYDKKYELNRSGTYTYNSKTYGKVIKLVENSTDSTIKTMTLMSSTFSNQYVPKSESIYDFEKIRSARAGNGNIGVLYVQKTTPTESLSVKIINPID